MLEMGIEMEQESLPTGDAMWLAVWVELKQLKLHAHSLQGKAHTSMVLRLNIALGCALYYIASWPCTLSCTPPSKVLMWSFN
jgi:hypothetical protein